MKVLAIFFLFYILNIGYVIMIDMRMGEDFSTSINHIKNPFRVISLPEYCIIIMLLLFLFLPPIVASFKKIIQTKRREP
ncbi:hypothetical protein [Ectobacillus funiculus]|uniref:Uncharacterized protein n=1 Tax=Ectobacillus funiculus TaxID=137993 RepID=A0ABV5WMI2_9BACI